MYDCWEIGEPDFSSTKLSGSFEEAAEVYGEELYDAYAGELIDFQIAVKELESGQIKEFDVLIEFSPIINVWERKK